MKIIIKKDSRLRLTLFLLLFFHLFYNRGILLSMTMDNTYEEIHLHIGDDLEGFDFKAKAWIKLLEVMAIYHFLRFQNIHRHTKKSPYERVLYYKKKKIILFNCCVKSLSI